MRGGSLRNALAVAALVATASCAAAQSSDSVDVSEEGVTALDRYVIGQAAKYPADATLRGQIDQLDGSIALRRKMAWDVVARMLTPVKIAAQVGGAPRGRLEMPRFQTWYSREDFLPMFDRLFRGMPDADKRARRRFTENELAGVFPWEAKMAPSLASFTKERYLARLHDLATPDGVHSLGGNGRVLMSPSYVTHLLRSYPELATCKAPAGSADPPTATSFAPCLDGEFPPDAAAVKMRWMPGMVGGAATPLPTFDTSADGITKKLAHGAFSDGDATANPTDQDIYTMQLTPDTTQRLAALHIVTKELRDWSWITLWWSPDPNTDFGADRPASISALGGPWKNYKMCVATGYAEKDASAGKAFAATAPTLAAALAAAAASGPSTWCSNPYLELGANNVQTNCIGCHQHAGTGETTASILGAPAIFPDHGRTKIRKNFPTDYTYTTSSGLDLASSIKDTIGALTPP